LPLNGLAERTEVLHGTKNVLDAQMRFFSNTRERIDTCMNTVHLGIEIEQIKKAFLDAKSRGARLRYLTEITIDNISYCKMLRKIVDELRHLDGMKGNFMISESEYLAPVILEEEGKVASLIYSNIDQIVEQQQYMFETLWSKAIPSEQRIREIEGGVQLVSTRILEDQDQTINEIRRLNYKSTRLSVCSGFGGMQMAYKYLFDSYMNILDKYQNGEGEGIRWVVNIDKENLNLVKVFLKAGIQIRHIKNMPPMNFGITDIGMAGTIEKMEGGKMSQGFLFSNEPLYINHFNSLFEEIWKNGIDAKVKMKAIEEGADSEEIEIFQDPVEIQKRAFSLIQTAQEEILVMFSTANAFHRLEQAGGMTLLKEAAMERGVKIRILTPKDELILESAQKLMMLQQESRQQHEYIGIKYIKPHLQTKVSILIIDKKYSLGIDLKDDTKPTSIEAIGLATYSNSQSTVSCYAAIFESLWIQTELYQKLKESEEVKDDFVHIAAHELRTPIQPILVLTQLLRTQVNNVKQQELLEITIRNAKRLQRLTNDILDVTKIEAKTLELYKEDFDLNDVMTDAMNDITLSTDSLKNENIKLSYNPQDILIHADKGRISQVISNLLANAIKFTTQGTIFVSVEKNKKNNSVIICVKDSGQGIDSTILPRLFTKFASKSYKGTGLGLFISKGIIEAHGGKIWAENNIDGKGATFAFNLPLNELTSR
jgi:two-component system, OmpR family, sensor histidine kinase VicK